MPKSLGRVAILVASIAAGPAHAGDFPHVGGASVGVGLPLELEGDVWSSATRPAYGLGFTMGTSTMNLRLVEGRLPLWIFALRGWTGVGFLQNGGYGSSHPKVAGWMVGTSAEVGAVDLLTGYLEVHYVLLGSPQHTGNDRVMGSFGIRFYLSED